MCLILINLHIFFFLFYFFYTFVSSVLLYWTQILQCTEAPFYVSSTKSVFSLFFSNNSIINFLSGMMDSLFSSHTVLHQTEKHHEKKNNIWSTYTYENIRHYQTQQLRLCSVHYYIYLTTSLLELVWCEIFMYELYHMLCCSLCHNPSNKENPKNFIFTVIMMFLC